MDIAPLSASNRRDVERDHLHDPSIIAHPKAPISAAVQAKFVETISIPSPGLPMILPAGTRTFSNFIRGEIVALCPVVSRIPVTLTPGALPGTMITARDS
jgi:hypothetical protein